MSDKTIRPGDWVRFYRDGALVVGVVSYVRPRASWEKSDTACTDHGTVKVDHVLEVRKALESQKGAGDAD